MKIKTSELTGAALDWAVAKCEGGFDLHQRLDWHNKPWAFFFRDDEDPERVDKFYLNEYEPSTDWAQGGPIIEREEISVEPLYTAGGLDCWQAYGHNLRYDDQGNYIQGSDNRQYGSTPLVAAMRCHIAFKLGDEVEVPKELLA